MLVPVDSRHLRSVWDYVERGLWAIIDKTADDWIPADVYAEIRGGVSRLFMMEYGGERRGFVVVQLWPQYHNGPRLFIRALLSEPGALVAHRADVYEDLDELARSLDMEIKVRFTEPRRRQRMAVMVTKEPHCLQKIIEAVKARSLSKAEAALVVSNRRDLEPLARRAGLSFSFVPWDDRARAEENVLRLLEEYEIDFVVLARFMKILSPNFVWRYKNKIINIHPSLLPSFPGPQAYRQAYERGVKIIGVSAHFVTMHLDEGPIIAQDCFRVRPEMTLKEIVAAGQKLEATTLLRAIKLYLEKRLDVYWGIVKEV